MGPSWTRPKLAPRWAHVAAVLDRNVEFGRYGADMQNVQITAAGKIFVAGLCVESGAGLESNTFLFYFFNKWDCRQIIIIIISKTKAFLKLFKVILNICGTFAV